ncbi:MAG: LysR family transcriptional regulator substrate-binding protein [Burkholderiales bacterium]
MLILRQAFEERGLPAPRIALVSDLVTFRLRAVASSDLLGIAVKPNIQEAATRFRLQILPVKRTDWVRRVAVAYRKDKYLSPAARRFIEILKATAATQL